MKLTEGTAYELVQGLQQAVLETGEINLAIMVEDENGRCENAVYLWYDEARDMLRLSVEGVEFVDYTDCE